MLLPQWAQEQDATIASLTQQLTNLTAMLQQQQPAAPPLANSPVPPPQPTRVNHASIPAYAALLPTPVRNAVHGPGAAATLPPPGATTPFRINQHQQQQPTANIIMEEGSPISHDLTEQGYEDINSYHEDDGSNLVETSSLLQQLADTLSQVSPSL